MKTAKLLALMVMALILSACGTANAATPAPEVIPPVAADKTIIAEGRLEPVQYADIAYNASGVISDVLVKEGDQVKQGQTLIRLGDATDKGFAAAQLELVTAQQAYDNLINSPGTGLAQAVIDLKAAHEAYDKADDYLRFLQNSKKVPRTETYTYTIQTPNGVQIRYRNKSFKAPAPEGWIIEAENDLTLKKAQLADAERTYDRLKDGVDSDQLALLEARLNAAKAGVASLEVTAPFDGVIARLEAKAAESIHAGGIAATIADFSNWSVKTTDLTEIDVVNVAEGQRVGVTLDAIPDVSFAGEVESISQTFAERQGDVVYEVTIALQDTNPAMLWGMTAVVKFDQPQD